MSQKSTTGRVGKLQRVLAVANLCLWIYFWLSFAHFSYQYRPNPLGHPAGTGYTFWGHAIAVAESPNFYLFFRVLYRVEWPSFQLPLLALRSLYSPLLLYGFFGGVSKGGWLLLAVMPLSFFQWYLVGLFIDYLRHRLTGKPSRSAGRVAHA
jgi:hypothetical protein